MYICFNSPLREVQKAILVVKNLFSKWRELQEAGGMSSQEELEYTTNELRNSLRSIEWDLEDLEETVDILFCFLCQWFRTLNIFHFMQT